MGSSWLQWVILSALTGSPVGSAIALLVFWYAVDRMTLGVFPDLTRPLMRWRRMRHVEYLLRQNPHDGRARLELAQLYVERGRGKQAVEVLRPTFDQGADDIQSVFTMGAACLQAGYVAQGEKLLDHAEELDHDFRVGEIFLVRGKARLARADWAGAKAAFESFIGLRSGTVQGRTLLALALRGLGDDASAALMRDQAWHEFVVAPRYVRRQERWWAWRARPSRPATYLLILVLVVALLNTVVAPKINAWVRRAQPEQDYVDPGLADPDE